MIRALIAKLRTKKVSYPKNGDAAHAIKPAIISRSKHNISRQDISESALKVLYRLKKRGHSAYLVGGGVRDLLLGGHPKDFDIVTDAKPEQVKQCFSNCRIIGRRFKLAHVVFGREIIEVATFRAFLDPKSEKYDNHKLAKRAHSDTGMLVRDNVYGSICEDVWRRDFTINALYYNIKDFSIVDFVGGLKDLKTKKLKMIGPAKLRYQEDPVRMLRAIRFAGKLDFNLDQDLIKAIPECLDLLDNISSARIFEEALKLFHSKNAVKIFELLVQYDLFQKLFPAANKVLDNQKYPVKKFIELVLHSTDVRLKEHKPINPAFLYAAMLWYPICIEADKQIKNKVPLFPARLNAMEKLVPKQQQITGFPKVFVHTAKEIWVLQMQLYKIRGKKAKHLMQNPRFRAAYDLLLLRQKAGENISKVTNYWQNMVKNV